MTALNLEDEPHPLGISAATGRPISGFSDDLLNGLLGRQQDSELLTLSLSMRADSTGYFGVMGGFNPQKLEEVGWGVIIPPGIEPEFKAALQPLIELRESVAKPMRMFEGDDAPFVGEAAEDWLKRHKVRMETVNPMRGIPYYILIVAPPELISFEFQYSLDLFWAVGRVWFDKAEDFAMYAESVRRYEMSDIVSTTRNVAIFSTQHDFDQATQLFMKQVAKPMIDGEVGIAAPLGKNQNFGVQTYLRDDASKATLESILRGSLGGVPSVLFTGTHGMQFEPEDDRQRTLQGAIVCQDWQGYGSITEKHWFSGADVPGDAKCHGLFHVLFACHGGGCTEFDDFDQLNDEPRKIAKTSLLASLPKALLSHKNGGALAVLAHVERAWAYSFQDQNGGSQTDGLRDVVARLLSGERIGQATDSFNLRWAAIATQLSDRQLDMQRNVKFPPRLLSKLWIARNDARNFIIIGDPAVRLKVERI